VKRVLSRKLGITYTGIVIAVIVLSAIAFYRYNIYILLANGISNTEQFGADTMAQVDMQLKAMDVNSIDLASNFELINALDQIVTFKNADEQNFNIVKAILIKNYVNKVNIHRISIFTVFGDLFTTGNTDATADDVKNIIFKSKWYSDIVVQSGRRIFLPPQLDVWDKSSGAQVISLIRAIKNGDNVIGYIEVQQKIDVIQKICSNEWNGINLSLAIVGRDGDVFYTNITREDKDEYIKKIIDKTRNETSRVVETQNELINVTDSNYTEYKSYLVLDKSVLFASLKVILWYLILIVLVLMILSGVFITIVTQKMTKPITTFVRKMAKVDLDNLKEPFEYNSNDYETEVLNRSFKDMKDRLTDSITKQLVLEAIQTKTLFNILQSEIGPHFLYNSLGSIANMCELGENQDAAEACYNLSEILRYASDFETTIVSIGDEIVNLKSYMELMKSRYRQRLDYSIEIADDTREFMVPKLTFQPLVENAIKYSLIENESVFVNVKTQMTQSTLNITVSDNGCGISREKLEEIECVISSTDANMENSQIKSKIKFGGMGLIGTLLRLKLYLGEDFHYSIVNNASGGMTVTIDINQQKQVQEVIETESDG